jgi:fibronectin-binding autotransporter adhesin
MRPENHLVIAETGFRSMRPRLRRVLFGTTAMVVVAAGAVQAQDWTGDGVFNDWTDDANWSAGGVPNAQDAEAVIDVDDTSPDTVYLGNTDITVGSLKLTDADDIGDSVQISRFGFGKSTLTFDSSTGPAEFVSNLDSPSRPVIDDSVDVLLKSDLKLSGTGSYEVESSITARDGDRMLIVSPDGNRTITLSGEINDGQDDAVTSVRIDAAETSGTVVLSASNGFTGDLTVAKGTVELDGGNDTLADTVAVGLEGGGLALTSGNETVKSLNVTSGSLSLGTASIGRDLTATGDVTKTTSGTFTVDGSGALNAASLTVSTGLMSVEDGATLGMDTITIDAPGSLEVNGGALDSEAAVANAGTLALGGDETIARLNGAGVLVLSNAARLTLRNGASDVSGNVLGNGGLTVDGGQLGLSGDNTYTGVTRVSRGTLTIDAASALSDAGTYEIGGGSQTARLLSSVTSLDFSNGLSLSDNAVVGTQDDTALTLSGALDLSGDVRFGAAGQGGRVTVSSDTLTSNASVTVAAGTLQIGSTAAGTGLLANGDTTVDAGAVLDMNGIATTLGALNGAGLVTSSVAGAASLTLNGDAAWDGTIEDGAGTVAVTVAGGGTSVFSGDNTYSGATRIISGSTLRLAAQYAIANSAVAIEAGSTLELAQSATTAGLSGAGQLNLGTHDLTVDSAVASTFSGSSAVTSGGLIKDGAGALTITSAQSYTGTTRVAGGQLMLSDAGALNSGAIVLAGGDLTATGGALSSSASVAVGAASQLSLSGAQTLAEVSGAGAVALTTDTTELTLRNDSNTTFDGVISGATGGKLVKAGAGTLTLNGSNTYTGGTQISGGAIAIGDSGALGTGTVALVGGTVLSAQDATLANALTINTNGGTLAAGDGTTLALTGALTLDGEMRIGRPDQAGTVGLAVAAAPIVTDTSRVTVAAGTLSLGTAAAGTVLNKVETIAIASDATLDLNGQSLLPRGLSGEGAIVNNSATMANLTFANDLNFAGAIRNSTGKLGLIKTGAGTTTTLGSGTDITASTSVQSGSLVVAGGSLGAVTVDSTGRFALQGGSAGAVNNAGTGSSSSGTISGLSNTGTFTNSGTINGATTLTAGTMTNTGDVQGTTTLGTGATLTSSGQLVGGVVQSGGSLNITGGAVSGVVTTSAGTVSVTGGSVASLSLTGDAASASNAGSIGTLNVSAGSFDNQSGGLVSGTTTISGGNLTNSGTMGDLDASGSTAVVENAAGGTIAGDVIVSASAELLASGGAFSGDVTVLGDKGAGTGVMQIASDTDIAGNLTNNGLIESAASGAAVTVTVTDTFTNTGTLSSTDGALTIAADTIVLSGNSVTNGVTLKGAVESSGDLTLANDLTGDLTITNGVTTTSGNINAGGNDLVVGSAGALVIADGTTTSNAGTLQNAGSVSIGAGSVLEAGVITNTSGTIALGAGARLQGTGNTLNNTSTITVAEGGTVADAGAINNNAGGTISLAGSGVLNANSDNTGNEALNNAGVIVSADGGNDTITLGDGAGDRIINTAGGRIQIGASDTFDGTGASLTNIGSGSTTAVITMGAGSSLLLSTLDNAALGQIDNIGTIRAAISNAGTLNSSGTLAGNVDNNGTGVLSLTGGVLEGTLQNRSGARVTISGDVSGIDSITQSSSAAFDITSGTVLLDAGATITNTTTFDISGGTLTAASGVLGVTNSSGATLTVAQGGALQNASVSNAQGATLDLAGTASGSVTNAGTANLSGTLDGSLVNQGTLALSGRVSGDVENADGATFSMAGLAAIDGTLTNYADLLLDGALDVGLLQNNATTTAAMDGSASLSEARFRVASTLNGALNNATVAALSNGSAITGAVSNTGLLIVQGTVQGGASLNNASGAVIDMQNGSASDVLRVNGDAVLNGTIYYDADLSGATNTSDVINVSGAVSGSPVLSFNNTGSEFRRLSDDGVTLITYGTDSTLRPSTAGLPETGPVLYNLVNNTTSNSWQLQSGVNPAVGGLASGLALTQSLISSVVNRPTSPFVSGLAAGDDDACGLGNWARGSGGHATASGETETALGTFDGKINASYSGLQAGFDHSCFDGYYNGWNLTFGGILGVNEGRTSQTVYRFDTATAALDPSVVSSVNKTDFSQIYGGVYLGAARGRLFADLQFRTDQTKFDLENHVVTEALGVSDQTYRSRGNTLSGTVGYSFAISEDKSVSLVPSVGFAYSKSSVDDLKFENDPSDPTDNGVLRIDDIESKMGFASLTLAKSKVMPSGTSALNYFGTATLYNDFASDVTSRYYERFDAQGNPIGNALTSESSNLGFYSEVSVGVNYTRLMDSKGAVPARQFDASVRLDGRVSDTLDGWGLTAQMRLQF